MNKNYKILGIIISGLNKDYPNKVSKNFADNVMSKINSRQISNKISFNKTDFFNVAASIFFAVITSIILLEFNSSENNLVVKDINEKETVNKDIIRKVIDKDACTDEIKNDIITSNECN